MMFKIITVNGDYCILQNGWRSKTRERSHVLHFVKVHCCSAKVGQGKVESLDLSPAML